MWLPTDSLHVRIFAKWNRNCVSTVQLIKGVLGLTPEQIEFTDLLDEILSRPKIMLKMYPEPGDLQILSNHVMLHPRTDYIDHTALEENRTLSRLWLAPPDTVKLPESGCTCFRSKEPGTVRGVSVVSNTINSAVILKTSSEVYGHTRTY